MKLLIVSICKNEEKTIAELIRRVPQQIAGVTDISVLVIDDGSTDNTAGVAKAAGAEIVSDGMSKGLAYRFREVVDLAIERKVDALVNIDGDLQFSPEDIPRLVAPVVAEEADFVAADRFIDPATNKVRKPKNMSSIKYHGNKVGARIVSKLSNGQFNDVTCGFRAYNQKALVKLNINGRHTYTQESFQVLAAKRVRIVTIPIDVRYFKDRQSRVVTSVPKFIATSGVNILRAYRDFAPLRFFVTLGMLPFTLGTLCLLFMGYWWLDNESFSPYKFVGFAGIYLVTLGLLLWGLGLLADMLVRVLNNQEKIYEDLRKQRLDK